MEEQQQRERQLFFRAHPYAGQIPGQVSDIPNDGISWLEPLGPYHNCHSADEGWANNTGKCVWRRCRPFKSWAQWSWIFRYQHHLVVILCVYCVYVVLCVYSIHTEVLNVLFNCKHHCCERHQGACWYSMKGLQCSALHSTSLWGITSLLASTVLMWSPRIGVPISNQCSLRPSLVSLWSALYKTTIL